MQLMADLVVPAQFENRIHSLSLAWTAMQDKRRWKTIVQAHTPAPVGKPPPPKRKGRFAE
eukprot:2235314-Prorocentrum_lima.AAC.1